jgi:hypothetical protein
MTGDVLWADVLRSHCDTLCSVTFCSVPFCEVTFCRDSETLLPAVRMQRYCLQYCTVAALLSDVPLQHCCLLSRCSSAICYTCTVLLSAVHVLYLCSTAVFRSVQDRWALLSVVPVGTVVCWACAALLSVIPVAVLSVYQCITGICCKNEALLCDLSVHHCCLLYLFRN